MLNSRGVARANPSICIISARGQEVTQGPQWVQGKALVGGPGGQIPPGSWILPDLHTSEPVCVSVFCSAYSSLSVFYGQIVCAGDGYRKHILRIRHKSNQNQIFINPIMAPQGAVT
jgi:hypothetical protein